jgi:hypothetical protein
MKRLLLGMLALLLAGSALAGGVRAVRERVESSMLVTGTIGVTPQGTVLGYTLDQPEKLPPVVVQMLGKAIPQWTFQPMLQAGKPVAAKARMNLRVVATPIGQGNYRLAVRGAYFGDQDQSIRVLTRARPTYPREAINERAGGTAFVILRVDRDGHVADAFAEQVNMTVLGTDTQLARLRKLLGDASVQALRRWTFTPADASDHEPYRYVRTPVSYQLSEWGHSPKQVSYGQWQSYVPGPVEPAPWFDKSSMLSGQSDALPDDGLYGRAALLLRTPLDKG